VWCDELILIFAEIINEVKIKKEKEMFCSQKISRFLPHLPGFSIACLALLIASACACAFACACVRTLGVCECVCVRCVRRGGWARLKAVQGANSNR
jgi:hypothetical protein